MATCLIVEFRRSAALGRWRGIESCGEATIGGCRRRSCRWIAAHQLTPEMAEPVARSSRVLFLDASHTGAPGEIRCERIGRQKACGDPQFQHASVSHHLAPSALLELAARYFHAEPEAWLLTITGDNFDLGESFSPAVEAA